MIVMVQVQLSNKKLTFIKIHYMNAEDALDQTDWFYDRI